MIKDDDGSEGFLLFFCIAWWFSLLFGLFWHGGTHTSTKNDAFFWKEYFDKCLKIGLKRSEFIKKVT